MYLGIKDHIMNLVFMKTYITDWSKLELLVAMQALKQSWQK